MQVSSPTRISLKITPQSRPAQDDPVEHVFSVPMVVTFCVSVTRHEDRLPSPFDSNDNATTSYSSLVMSRRAHYATRGQPTPHACGARDQCGPENHIQEK